MKKSSVHEPLNQALAQKCFLINQFATPGLGSLMGQRFISGVGQLLLALVGFVLVMGWFILMMTESFRLAESDAPVKSYAWIGIAGGAIFAAAWGWSLITSIDLLRHAKKNSPTAPEPPRQPMA